MRPGIDQKKLLAGSLPLFVLALFFGTQALKAGKPEHPPLHLNVQALRSLDSLTIQTELSTTNSLLGQPPHEGISLQIQIRDSDDRILSSHQVEQVERDKTVFVQHLPLPDQAAFAQVIARFGSEDPVQLECTAPILARPDIQIKDVIPPSKISVGEWFDLQIVLREGGGDLGAQFQLGVYRDGKTLMGQLPVVLNPAADTTVTLTGLRFESAGEHPLTIEIFAVEPVEQNQANNVYMETVFADAPFSLLKTSYQVEYENNNFERVTWDNECGEHTEEIESAGIDHFHISGNSRNQLEVPSGTLATVAYSIAADGGPAIGETFLNVEPTKITSEGRSIYRIINDDLGVFLKIDSYPDRLTYDITKLFGALTYTLRVDNAMVETRSVQEYDLAHVNAQNELTVSLLIADDRWQIGGIARIPLNDPEEDSQDFSEARFSESCQAVYQSGMRIRSSLVSGNGKGDFIPSLTPTQIAEAHPGEIHTP